jgi:hypothetical protein
MLSNVDNRTLIAETAISEKVNVLEEMCLCFNKTNQRYFDIL